MFLNNCTSVFSRRSSWRVTNQSLSCNSYDSADHVTNSTTVLHSNMCVLFSLSKTGVTILLSLTMLSLLVAESMPKTSSSVSLMGKTTEEAKGGYGNWDESCESKTECRAQLFHNLLFFIMAESFTFKRLSLPFCLACLQQEKEKNGHLFRSHNCALIVVFSLPIHPLTRDQG